MNTKARRAIAARAAAVALLVVALGVTLSVTALPVWLVNSEFQDELDGLQERLTRYEHIAESDADLRRYLARLERAQASGGHLLRSESPMVAAAEMQAALEKIADANDTQLISTQIVEYEGKDDAELVRVALSVRARGMLGQLIESVHALEASPTLFFVEDFVMQTANTRRARGQEPQKIFETTFTLVGYMATLQ